MNIWESNRKSGTGKRGRSKKRKKMEEKKKTFKIKTMGSINELAAKRSVKPCRYAWQYS